MSRRLLKPVDEWHESDVLALIAERVPEGQRLDYKRELNLDSRSERKEAAKDASGMANASGGLLIYGVDEDKSIPEPVPFEPTPLPDGQVQTQLEDLLDDTVAPTLNMETALVSAAAGGFFLLVSVFQRAGPPHMVEGYDENRHYIRVGVKTRPMKQNELERAYATVTAAESRFRQLLDHLPLLTRVNRRETTQEMQAKEAGTRRPWSSVITVPLDASSRLLAKRVRSANDFPMRRDIPRLGETPIHFQPFAIDGYGYLEERRLPSSRTAERVRLYRNGVCEWAQRYSDRDGQAIPSIALARDVHDALAYFASVYQQADYHGRLRALFRMDNAEASLFLAREPDGPSREYRVAAEDVGWIMSTHDTNVDTLARDPKPITHWMMDELWQTYGFGRCLLFSAEGEWLRTR